MSWLLMELWCLFSMWCLDPQPYYPIRRHCHNCDRSSTEILPVGQPKKMPGICRHCKCRAAY